MMSTLKSRTTLAGSLLAAALMVAACGGSNTAASSHQHTSTGTPGPTTTASTPSTTTATAPTGTATSPTTTSTTGTSNSGGVGVGGTGPGSACVAADLTPALLNSNGAAGHVVITYTLKNTGSSACHTYGYPGVEFLSRTGAPIKTNATRTTDDFAGHLTEAAITLQPGQEASFRMVTSDVASSQNACVTAYGLQIIAPDDTATMKASVPGIDVCDGKATVSPLVAGTGASST